MNNRETDIQAALNEFYCRCPLTRIFVGDDYITYRIGYGEHSQAAALDTAQNIINDLKLPLKAKIIGFPLKNILQISAL